MLMAGITINNKFSLFDTASCFMSKDPKAQYDESDSGSDQGRSQDLDIRSIQIDNQRSFRIYIDSQSIYNASRQS